MKIRTRLLAALLAVAMAFMLAGCDAKETAINMAYNMFKKLGLVTENTDDSESTTDIYATEGGSITFPEVEGFDATSRFATTIQEGTLYIAFNGIANRSTGYFTPAGSSITLTSYASTDSPGLKEYKAALWELSADEASTSYVGNTTVYFTTTENQACYTYTLDGLNPASRYKVVVSYDSSAYYITGGMKVEGIAGDALKDVEGEADKNN